MIIVYHARNVHYFMKNSKHLVFTSSFLNLYAHFWNLMFDVAFVLSSHNMSVTGENRNARWKMNA